MTDAKFKRLIKDSIGKVEKSTKTLEKSTKSQSDSLDKLKKGMSSFTTVINQLKA